MLTSAHRRVITAQSAHFDWVSQDRAVAIAIWETGQLVSASLLSSQRVRLHTGPTLSLDTLLALTRPLTHTGQRACDPRHTGRESRKFLWDPSTLLGAN